MIVCGLSDTVLGPSNAGPPLRHAGIGVWQWNATKDEALLCPGMAEIFGFPLEAASDRHRLADVILRVHPDDRPRVVDASTKASVSGGSCVLRYRTMSDLGGVRHVLCNGWYTAAGEEPGGCGVVVDLSRRGVQVDDPDFEPLDRFARHALAAWAELPNLSSGDHAALEPSLRALLTLIGRRTALQVAPSKHLLS